MTDVRSTLLRYYKEEINDVQFYFRMNQAGFSKEPADDLFDLLCISVSTKLEEQRKAASATILSVLLISTLLFIWMLL